MPTSKNKKQMVIYFDKEPLERFEYLYPDCVKEFCKRAIRACLQDKVLFDRIFFMNVK